MPHLPSPGRLQMPPACPVCWLQTVTQPWAEASHIALAHTCRSIQTCNTMSNVCAQSYISKAGCIWLQGWAIGCISTNSRTSSLHAVRHLLEVHLGLEELLDCHDIIECCIYDLLVIANNPHMRDTCSNMEDCCWFQIRRAYTS